MGRRIILIILMLGALGYAINTYAPIVAPYLARPAEVEEKVVATLTTAVTTTTAAEAAPVKKKETTTTLPPKNELKLIDPFALRVAVVSKKEAAEAAQRAKERREEAPQAPEGPKLEGIWIGSGLKAAFISGQVMTEGGIIMGWRVAKINPDNVVLRKGRAVKVLKLGGEVE